MLTLMREFLVLCLVLGDVTFHVAGVEPACPYQPCTCTATTINCWDLKLKTLPPLQSSNGTFTHLDVSWNDIRTIKYGDLPPGLVSLDLRSNPIETVSDSAFNDSAQTLNSIAFSSVKFDSLPKALMALENLTSLSIEDVAIKSYPSSILFHLASSVTSLTLRNVGLQVWPSWLSRFVLLNTLNLGFNHFGSIPANALQPWENQLIDLNLDGIDIRDTSPLSVCTVLQKLSMTNNLISDHILLSYSLIPSFNTLWSIDFQFNNLNQLPRLSSFSNLVHIILGGNAISIDDEEAFPDSLQILDLTSNTFTHVPESLKSLRNLRSLNMSDNKITTLGPHLFPINSSLETLRLDDNQISDIYEHAFDNARHLNYLSLRYLTLTRLPIALAVLDKLKYLDLTGNGRLECTCDEISVFKRIMNTPALLVHGQCKFVDIAIFASKLIGNC